MSANPNPLPSVTAPAQADGVAGFVAEVAAAAASLPGAHRHSPNPHEHAPHNADAPGACCGGCANQLNCSKAQAWHQE